MKIDSVKVILEGVNENLFLLHFTTHVSNRRYRRCRGNCDFHRNEP